MNTIRRFFQWLNIFDRLRWLEIEHQLITERLQATNDTIQHCLQSILKLQEACAKKQISEKEYQVVLDLVENVNKRIKDCITLEYVHNNFASKEQLNYELALAHDHWRNSLAANKIIQGSLERWVNSD